MPAKKSRPAAKPAPAKKRAARKPSPKPPAPMLLRLYIAGTSIRSTRAIQNARKMCDEHLSGRYQLEVIDIFQHPALAKDHQILAVPTLIRALPIPLRRFIGDLSDQDVVLVGLDLKAK
jgi:circadian clock protein KaiB